MTYLNKALFPKKEEIFSWIENLCQWGHRKTGTPEGRKSAEYIAGKFKEFGMEDVEIEKVPSMCMFVKEHSLEIDGEEIENFYVNGTNRGAEEGVFSIGENGEQQEFVFAGDGLDKDFEKLDVKDKIVICSINLLDASPLDMLEWNENWECYDPDNRMAGKKKSDIYSPCNWPGNYFKALKKGAKGFIGILENYMDDPYWYNEDYTEIGEVQGIKYMSLPAMWISRSAGKKLKEKMAGNKSLKGHMKMISEYAYKDALNVKGVLPGISDDIILVHSHHDAVFAGAVQDASGISEMLALGKYFSQLPKEERKKTMMFAATDTHYTDYMGHQGFIRRRQADKDNIILDIAIEHVAKEAVFDENMNLYETGEPESRLFYIGEETGMYDFVKDTVKKYGLDKSIFGTARTGKGLDTDELYEFKQDEVISDGYYFNESGIPVISVVSGPQYLFHPSDTPDRIPLDLLEPVGMAFAEIALEAADRL